MSEHTHHLHPNSQHSHAEPKQSLAETRESAAKSAADDNSSSHSHHHVRVYAPYSSDRSEPQQGQQKLWGSYYKGMLKAEVDHTWRQRYGGKQSEATPEISPDRGRDDSEFEARMDAWNSGVREGRIHGDRGRSLEKRRHSIGHDGEHRPTWITPRSRQSSHLSKDPFLKPMHNRAWEQSMRALEAARGSGDERSTSIPTGERRIYYDDIPTPSSHWAVSRDRSPLWVGSDVGERRRPMHREGKLRHTQSVMGLMPTS